MLGEPIWQRFVRLLEQLPKLRGAALEAEDSAFAAALAAEPGVLEAQLVARIDELGARASDRAPSLLGYFWDLRPVDHPGRKTHPEMFRCLAATFAALDARQMMRFYEASRHHTERMGHVAAHNGVHLASYFLARAGVAMLDELVFVPEHRDLLRSLAQNTPLPDVLPADLTTWTPRQITDALATYTGRSTDELEQRLRPSFLAADESLGDVIHRDAATLARLKISRHAVADRLQLVIDVARHNHAKRAGRDAMPSRDQRLREQLGPPRADGYYEHPFTCGFTSFAGVQQDPFHTASGAPVSSSDFHIANPMRGPDAILDGPELIVPLIRCYGFFEGTVRHRVDPALAAWVLGLTDAPPTRVGSQPIATQPLATQPSAPVVAPTPHAPSPPTAAPRSWWRRAAALFTPSRRA